MILFSLVVFLLVLLSIVALFHFLLVADPSTVIPFSVIVGYFLGFLAAVLFHSL